MSDIGLVFDTARGMDFAVTVSSGLRADLKTDEGLRTAVLLSLFLDRQADTDDPLPGATDDRRGFWADEFADTPGDKCGSKLWLLARAKSEPGITARAEAYAREALAWLVSDGVALSVEVTAEIQINPYRTLALNVRVQRPDRDPAEFRFGALWTAEGERT